MAVYDHDGTTSRQIEKIYDHDGTTYYPIGKIYDNDGTVSSLIYSYGNPAGPYEWTSPDMTGGNVYGALSASDGSVNGRPLYQAFDRTLPYNQSYGVLYANEWLLWTFPPGKSHLIFKWQLEINYIYNAALHIQALDVTGAWHTAALVKPAAVGVYSGSCDLTNEITAIKITQNGSYTYYRALQFWGF